MAGAGSRLRSAWFYRLGRGDVTVVSKSPMKGSAGSRAFSTFLFGSQSSVRQASAALTAFAAASSAGNASRSRSAALTAFTSVTASAAVQKSATTALTAGLAISASALRSRFASSALAASGYVASAVFVTKSATASISATLSLLYEPGKVPAGASLTAKSFMASGWGSDAELVEVSLGAPRVGVTLLVPQTRKQINTPSVISKILAPQTRKQLKAPIVRSRMY